MYRRLATEVTLHHLCRLLQLACDALDLSEDDVRNPAGLTQEFSMTQFWGQQQQEWSSRLRG